jgi:hypothetical protein
VLAAKAPVAPERLLSNQKGANQRLAVAVLQRMERYECDALDALYDLALMPISENARLTRIKYLAACELIGDLNRGSAKADDGLTESLRATQ